MNNPYFIVERVGIDTETSCNKYPEFQAWEEGRLAGLKEVVEWAEANLTYPTRGEGICFGRNVEWQAKLKEWGC